MTQSTPTLTPTILDELEALEKAATPGPVHAGRFTADGDHQAIGLSVVGGAINGCRPLHDDRGGYLSISGICAPEDATLIATLRNHAPALIAAARRVVEMEGEVARLTAELSAAIGYMMNARIDLETGATKATAITTIQGGVDRFRAALPTPAPGVPTND